VRRRDFLATSALIGVLPACGGEAEVMEIAPWHMWGTSELVKTTFATGGTNAQSTQQIARINYGRPESWAFFIAAEIVEGSQPADTITLTLDLDIIIGVGRSSFDTKALSGRQAFVRFVWQLTFGQTINVLDKKWVTEVQTPPTDDTDPTSTKSISIFPAQDIQVQSRFKVESVGPQPALSYSCNVSAFFSPLSHVRPEWFADKPDDQRFRGAEDNGK